MDFRVHLRRRSVDEMTRNDRRWDTYETICGVARYVCSDTGRAVVLVGRGDTGWSVGLMRCATAQRDGGAKGARCRAGWMGWGLWLVAWFRSEQVGVCSGVSMASIMKLGLSEGRSASAVDAMAASMIRGWKGVDDARRVDAATTGACGLVQALCTAKEARDGDAAPQDVLHGFTLPHSRLTRGAVAGARDVPRTQTDGVGLGGSGRMKTTGSTYGINSERPGRGGVWCRRGRLDSLRASSRCAESSRRRTSAGQSSVTGARP